MSGSHLSEETILVVEDHDDSRGSLDLFLRHSGANVLLARNAAEGIEAVTRNRLTVALLDIGLPDRSGFDLLREIRALGLKGGDDLPVIAISGLALHRQRALDPGFQEFLPKPFNPERLIDTILKLRAD